MAESFNVLRTEKKYVLPLATARKINAQLACVLPLDQNCVGERPYAVKSLYFDSIYDQDFFQKTAGLENRKKIRLRTYGDSGVFKLECKQKQGAKQRKQSLLVSVQDAKALAGGDYRCLLRYENDLARQLYATMTERVYRPKSMIQYQRLAYAVPTNDIRITFDSRIEASECNFDICASHTLWYPVQPFSQAVLEVKYNHFLLQQVQLVLEPFHLVESANSKYVKGRYFGLGVNVL